MDIDLHRMLLFCVLVLFCLGLQARLGTTLCIYCGDILPDFQEKICISKHLDETLS